MQSHEIKQSINTKRAAFWNILAVGVKCLSMGEFANTRVPGSNLAMRGIATSKGGSLELLARDSLGVFMWAAVVPSAGHLEDYIN